LIREKQVLSLEFFPPRDIAAQEKLVRSAKQLLALEPAYVSVTFGAGGSTRSGTVDAVRLLQNLGFDVAPHLSCIGSSRAVLGEILDTYRDMGVRRARPPRGDLPSGMGGDAGELHYAGDLVAFIREHCGDWFTIEVAAYPEVHPQASGAASDLARFAAKVKAGADGANYTQLSRFSAMCGAEIPRWIRSRLADFGDDRASIKSFGKDVVTRLSQDLLDRGAPGLHFYTLNNAEVAMAICTALRLKTAR
jgi:methylenetetrahydrofolate reductase (NADPH)